MIKQNDFRRVGFMSDSFRLLDDGFKTCCLASSILTRRGQNTIQRNVKKAAEIFT
jgi:hypothetical protein